MLIDYIRKDDQTIKIIPNHPIDIHILYEIIDETSKITVWTTRKVEIGNTKTRINVKLTIKVCESTPDFENNALNTRGTIQNEVENIQLGSFHNYTIGLNEPFILHTNKNLKDTVDKLLEQRDVFLLIIFRNSKFEVAAIDEYGLRRKGIFKQKEFKKYLSDTCSTTKPAKPQPFPLKSEFKVKYIVSNHMISNIIKLNVPLYTFNLLKTDEKLTTSQIFDRLVQNPISSSIPFMRDLVLANNFLLMYEKGDDKIALGMSDVLEAQDHFALQTLFITNKLFCSFNIHERNMIRKLIHTVRNKVKVVIVGDFHLCGTKLNDIGGIGAILTYDYRDSQS